MTKDQYEKSLTFILSQAIELFMSCDTFSELAKKFGNKICFRDIDTDKKVTLTFSNNWFDEVVEDVVPARHGHWEEEEIKQGENGRCAIEDWQSAKCSKCGKWHTTPYMYYFDNYNYCPNCGARMDEAEE